MKSKKVDERLQVALNKAIANKKQKERKTADAVQIAQDEHAKFIRKWMPKARKWINEKLFKQITEAETNGIHYLLLGRYEDSIPSEVIYEAAKKIKGLRPVLKRNPIYRDGEDTDREDTGEYIIHYSIEWDSTNPNDYRMD